MADVGDLISKIENFLAQFEGSKRAFLKATGFREFHIELLSKWTLKEVIHCFMDAMYEDCEISKEKVEYGFWILKKEIKKNIIYSDNLNLMISELEEFPLKRWKDYILMWKNDLHPNFLKIKIYLISIINEILCGKDRSKYF